MESVDPKESSGGFQRFVENKHHDVAKLWTDSEPDSFLLHFRNFSATLESDLLLQRMNLILRQLENLQLCERTPTVL